MHTPESLYANLTAQGIAFHTFDHEALPTVAAAQAMYESHPGAHVKNLFLRDKNHALTLVTALHDRSLNLRALGKHLGAKESFSFADEATLMQTLGVKPGAVSPLGLINAQPGSLRFVLDSGILAHPVVYPHPLINTQTVAMTPQDLLRAIQSWGHTPIQLDLSLFPKAQQAA